MSSPDINHLLACIVDRVNLGIFVVDRNMRLVLWNRFMEMHSGRASEEVLGRVLFEAFPELPEKWLRKKVDSVFLLENLAFTSWEQRPYLFRFRHNRPVTGGVDHMQQDCTFFPIKDAAGTVVCVGISVQDVTDTSMYQQMMKGALDSMQEMSVRDGLTGLYNRRHLESVLGAEFNRVQRYGGELSVLLFDLDHFKAVNDRFGHQAGDEVLRAVADRVREVLRQADVAGRYGGEEFTLILPNTDLEGAMHLAERVRQVIGGEPVSFRDMRIAVTVTVGVSSFRPPMSSHERLVHEADRALYRGKSAGRNQVCAFRPDPG